MAAPWMKWYPRDWRADPALRSCSLAARGLWIELIGYMHEATPYGHLLIGGSSPTHAEIGRFTGVHHNAVTALVSELVNRGVASVSPGGVIYSRRMVRDNEKALKNKENGAKGGNPELFKTDNPEVKAQNPEARGQKPERKKKVEAELPLDPTPQSKVTKLKLPIARDATISEYQIHHAAQNGFPEERARYLFNRFKDHHQAKGNKFASWDAAWRTWISNEIKYTRPDTGGRSGEEYRIL